MENKILEKKDLLTSVVEQLESMPSLLRITIEENILDEDIIFSLFEKSVLEKTSFYEILKKDSGLTSEDLNELVVRQNEKAKGLINIMIEKSFVDHERAKEILQSFEKWKQSPSSEVSEDSSHLEIDTERESKTEKEKATTDTAPISAAALESLREAGIDPGDMAVASEVEETREEEVEAEAEVADEPSVMLEEYLSFTNEAFQSELFVTSNRYRLKGKEEDLKSLHEAFTKILSLTKLNDLELQMKILKPLEDYLSIIMKNNDELSPEERRFPFEVLSLLWPMRELISKGKPEVSILNDSEFKDNYIEILKNLMVTIKRMS